MSYNTAEWSLLINKVQAGKMLAMTIAPTSSCLPTLDQPITSKVFTADAEVFSPDFNPSACPDCLVHMVLQKIFIPLSMLMTSSLSRIETNQNVKFKHILYGLGAGKFFLDESCFPMDDDLNNFEFNQVYANWLTLSRGLLIPWWSKGGTHITNT